MHPIDTWQRNLTRRQLFQRVGMGVGGFALADLLARDLGASPAANQVSHFAPKAKSVIYFHFVGAPSHLDLFDYKPELQKRTGELCPAEMFEGKQLAFIREHPLLLGTRFKFPQHGQGGLHLCEHLPKLGTVADDLCLVQSIRTEHFNHAPAQLFLSLIHI